MKAESNKKADEEEQKNQLSESQKMESLGKLSGTIAHDFNNLLTTILGYSDLILEQMKPDDPYRHFIEEIQKSGKRAADLTGQLLAFSRRQASHPKVFDLNEAIKTVEPKFKKLGGDKVTLLFDLSQDKALVNADPSQIEQVLANLTANACDACQNGGEVKISTQMVAVDNHTKLEKGSYVLLTVADNGKGMDPEVKEHIFEPFFTTKEKGKGTGLGLSTVYGIVKQSHGDIDVESQEGKGAVFKIYFPLAV